MNLRDVDDQLTGFDACLFCLGVSSAGMTEKAYAQITYGVTMAVGVVLARLNPSMMFAYVSGAGTDSTAQGRSMWARVKGKTENDLQTLPFAGVFLFRPGVIQPLHGIISKTPSYQVLYRILGPLLTVAHRMFPNVILTTEDIGNAILATARIRTGRAVLEVKDIARLARGGTL
jgi:uncharacterized protein YbjT (DUF2867 family)